MSTTIRRTAALRALLQAIRGSRTPGAPGLGQRFAALPRMLAMGLSGRYPHLDTSRMALAALALVYIVSPVDLIPELVVPLLGLGDDAFVAAWLAGALLSESDAFLAWEAGGSSPDVTVIPGEVLDDR